MKIYLVGSMNFVKNMVEIKKQLEEKGHEVQLPHDTNKFLNDPNYTTDNHEEDYKFCLDNNIMKKCFDSVAESDATLILNYKKGDIEGYVGAFTLMEMAIAHHFNKKIFLLNPPPDVKEHRSTHEVLIAQPIILNGNLDNIK